MKEHTQVYSWTIGPAESWVVRTMVYLALGWVVAYSATAALSVADSESFTLLFVGAALVFSPLIVFVFIVLRHDGAESALIPSLRWFYQSFAEQVRFVWLLPAIVVDGFVVAGLSMVLNGLAFDLASLGVFLVFLLGAFLLSSKGELDDTTATLRYHTPLSQVEWHVVDLKEVNNIRHVTIGQRTYFWVSFERGAKGLLAFRGPFVVPTELFENARLAFEARSDPSSREL